VKGGVSTALFYCTEQNPALLTAVMMVMLPAFMAFGITG